MDPYDSEDEILEPTVSIALEYAEKDEIFNFYIKKVSNTPLLQSYKQKNTRAVLYVVKGLNRTSWMGRARNISWQEMQSHCPSAYRTLSVVRHSMTVFNEFFSCQMSRELFHKTLLFIQICDVTKHDDECEYWIDTHPIKTFREFELPMNIVKPDLGELELTLCYLPSSQRLCIEKCRATNLRMNEKSTGVYIRVLLYTDGVFDEIHKSDSREGVCDPVLGLTFSRRLVFDLLRNDVRSAVMVVQAVEVIDGRKRVIGQFGLSHSSTGCERVLWKKVMEAPREKITEIMRLLPGF